MKMLVRELPYEKQQALAAMSMTPGWQVAKELCADAIKQASDEFFTTDLISDATGTKGLVLQVSAMAVQEFVQTFIRSVEVHSQAVTDEENL